MRGLLVVCVFAVFGGVSSSKGLLVVGDSGASSSYTTGASSSWDYVGYVKGNSNNDPSVSYVSNGWFAIATHVWYTDIIGDNSTTLDLGGTEYSINLGTYTSMTNANGSASDVSMFRVNSLAGLPTGTSVLESTPLWTDSLRLIGNGFDNEGSIGMTWGDGDLYATGNGNNRSTYTATDPLNGRETTYYLSVYNSGTTSNAYGQIWDSGGGAFVNDQLAGIMVAIGTGIGDGVTYIADFSVYGEQINAATAIPEPSVMMLGSVFAIAGFCIRRIFMI